MSNITLFSRDIETVTLDDDIHHITVGASSVARDAPVEDLSLPDMSPTVFYVNFLPNIPEELREELKKQNQDMLDMRCWATRLSNQQVRRKIDSGELKDTEKDKMASYRAKVFEAVLRDRTTWLANVIQVDNGQKLVVKSSEFHLEILRIALKGFPIPDKILGSLEDILQAIVESITTTTDEKVTKNFWIQATVFVYDDMAQTVQPKLRTINFTSNSTTYSVTKRKSSFTEATLEVSFTGLEADVNLKTWRPVGVSIGQEAIEEGKKLAEDDPKYDVPL